MTLTHSLVDWLDAVWFMTILVKTVSSSSSPCQDPHHHHLSVLVCYTKAGLYLTRESLPGLYGVARRNGFLFDQRRALSAKDSGIVCLGLA